MLLRWAAACSTLVALLGLTFGSVEAVDHRMETAPARLSQLIREPELQVLEGSHDQVRVQVTGLLPATESDLPSPLQEITILDWQVKLQPRDYSREDAPVNEHVGAFFRIRNSTRRTLSALDFTIQFLDTTGHLLHQEDVLASVNLLPGETCPPYRFWYSENNEFVTSDPFDIISPAVTNGSLELKIILRRAEFLDGVQYSSVSDKVR